LSTVYVIPERDTCKHLIGKILTCAGDLRNPRFRADYRLGGSVENLRKQVDILAEKKNVTRRGVWPVQEGGAAGKSISENEDGNSNEEGISNKGEGHEYTRATRRSYLAP
jgi:hypothetical protein